MQASVRWMQIRPLLAAAYVLACFSGCTSLHLAKQQVLVEGAQFNAEVEMQQLEIATAKAAEAALAVVKRGCPLPPHHEEGFKAGYADYLRYGGDGTPPPMPPHKYWGRKYQSECGRQAVRQWYAGFRHGSSMAQQSGLRSQITIPLSDLVSGCSQPPWEYPNILVNCDRPWNESSAPVVPQSLVPSEPVLPVPMNQPPPQVNNRPVLQPAVSHSAVNRAPRARITDLKPISPESSSGTQIAMGSRRCVESSPRLASLAEEKTTQPKARFTGIRPYAAKQPENQ